MPVNGDDINKEQTNLIDVQSYSLTAIKLQSLRQPPISLVALQIAEADP